MPTFDDFLPDRTTANGGLEAALMFFFLTGGLDDYDTLGAIEVVLIV